MSVNRPSDISVSLIIRFAKQFPNCEYPISSSTNFDKKKPSIRISF